ncbi:MAG: ribosome small subunit-dependent GTPase A [Planctomycetia bacterium]|nr:ribosome small subunit-dependent GTPase A [Planctomycetia bacterium]
MPRDPKNKKPSKYRADFRKNRAPRTRRRDWSEHLHPSEESADRLVQSERVSGKGDLTRRRTIVGDLAEGDGGLAVRRAVDEGSCLAGRVIGIYGLTNLVETDDGAQYRCATRRLLKTMQTDDRHVVVVGDRVVFRPSGGAATAEAPGEGVIERIEPRHGTLCRSSHARKHILVTNVDLALIVASAAQPDLKPHLIDRLLVTAEKDAIEPVICINKIDLVDPAGFQPLAGVYSQMGYPVLLLSAATGLGVERLRRAMQGRQSVIVGQSGVGKSSLLNAVDPTLNLKVREVSEETEKGRHTTSSARLIRLAGGGYVVDTPGIRQFELWDTPKGDVAAYFRDIRPFVGRCRFPDCTHRHEAGCAVKDAVADDLLDARRYDSYCHFWDD